MSTNAITKTTIAQNIERVLISGDLSKLSSEERLQYYKATCESLGLNPLTKPFDYIALNGKLVLYAKRDATDQLRKVHAVSITSIESNTVNDVFIVTAHAQDDKGRQDSSTGAVAIANLKGDALANALMKAETKAKRRVTLSICGLGLLDETEIETIPDAHPIRDEQDQRPETQQSQRGRPAPRREDVKCAQCGATNAHLSDCPTLQKKQAPAGPQTVGVLVQEIISGTTKGKNPRLYLVLRCMGNQKDLIDIYCFHETPMKHADKWEGKPCIFEISEKQKADKSKFWHLENVVEVGGVKYVDGQPANQPSADELFDTP